MVAFSDLVLLCGPAFSGKSTLARALAHRGFAHISLDEILRSRGFEPGRGLPTDAWAAATDQACTEIVSVLSAGQDGVIDDTLCFRFLRDRYRGVARSMGVEPRLVVLRIAPEEIHRRRVADEQTRERPGIDQDVLDEHLRTFEWPGSDELALELDANLETSELLPRILTSSRARV